jgi:beta-lactamase superfamily II metal-dependent hydrolase
MKFPSFLSVSLILPLLAVCAQSAEKSLDAYFIDVEGGQATLFVSPSGESLLVDTGWGGFESRDAKRIAAVAKLAGIKQIDYLVITHYHADHVGGVTQLLEQLPVKTFVDHGPNVETTPDAAKFDEAYKKAVATGKHLVVKPGDKIPVKGLDITVVSAAGDVIAKPLKGAGAPNPGCAGVQPKPEDKSENARSLGSMIVYGKFRIVDLGDLTWNKENLLACPDNKLGTVDVYLTTHHGIDQSGSPALVQALHPKVAIMNNGAKKGGSASAWQVIHNSPGLQDIWQVHFAVAGGPSNNTSEELIANPEGSEDAGNWIKLSAMANGAFTVTNGRTKFSKTYKP